VENNRGAARSSRIQTLVHITWSCYPERSFGLVLRLKNSKRLELTDPAASDVRWYSSLQERR
jgi:hypothetical protein